MRSRFHAYRDENEWAAAVATIIADSLRERLQQSGQARILLSGGKTPEPVYRALSHAELDWCRVDVALVDERWLRPDDPDSNAHLIRDTLLQDRAAIAHFEPLTQSGRTLAASVRLANEHALRNPDIVVLGMGDDGHTASLFPRARDLEHALNASSDYVAIDATGCSGAGPWPMRISLTPAGLSKAPHRLLLIRGDHKRHVLDRALDGDDPRELPVRIAFTAPGTVLQVHWYP
ncbi:MAG: 6-phosphogluconolactonase [Lysobacter sp.]|nr:6-phosphogluconolactonase [Lysobacter sp.]